VLQVPPEQLPDPRLDERSRPARTQTSLAAIRRLGSSDGSTAAACAWCSRPRCPMPTDGRCSQRRTRLQGRRNRADRQARFQSHLSSSTARASALRARRPSRARSRRRRIRSGRRGSRRRLARRRGSRRRADAPQRLHHRRPGPSVNSVPPGHGVPGFDGTSVNAAAAGTVGSSGGVRSRIAPSPAGPARKLTRVPFLMFARPSFALPG